jgi:DNA-binding NarL/FixJ family response regulator
LEKKDIQVVICDDNPVFSNVMNNLLMQEEDMHIVGVAATKEELLNIIQSSKPVDVLLMDINLRDDHYDGIEISIEINNAQPAIKIIMLSQLDNTTVISHAMTFGGVVNYITKDHYQDVPDAIRAAYQNQSGLHHSSAVKLIDNMKELKKNDLVGKLTVKQIEILKLLSQNYSREEIAGQLHFNIQTINNEICKITKVFKGKFPFLEWLHIKKHNTMEIVEFAKKINII